MKKLLFLLIVTVLYSFSLNAKIGDNITFSRLEKKEINSLGAKLIKEKIFEGADVLTKDENGKNYMLSVHKQMLANVYDIDREKDKDIVSKVCDFVPIIKY